jgi:hypothetical protein
MPKEEFELVIIDDQSTQDIKGLCREAANEYGLRFQFITYDRNKGAIPAVTFTPALSNNLGFKHARGSVVVVVGPETLVGENNLDLTWKDANAGYGVYGDVFRSNIKFVDTIVKDDYWKDHSFSDMLALQGAKADATVTKGWWWYYMGARKEHIFAINGVDEEYMKGIAGEDDNFANRLMASGLPLKRNHAILGIHQDHSREDKKEDWHKWRFDRREWRRLRNYNDRLFTKWMETKQPVANTEIEWGSENAIIDKETF